VSYAVVEASSSLWSPGFPREERTRDQHDAAERTLAQVEGWILGVI
jgi:hypothetical protein